MTTRKRKTESLFEAMADKSKKPDAAGYQPFDPRILKALGFKVFGE
jgi:hypothetical protein